MRLSIIAENSFEFATLELVSDDLLQAGTPEMLSFDVVDGEIFLDWDVARGMVKPDSLDMTGSAIFKYTTVKKDAPEPTTVEWDVYVACAADDVAARFTMSLFLGDQLVHEFEEVTPFATGGSSMAGDYKVVIDAGVEFQHFERFVRVVEGKQNYFAFRILPVGMNSDCIEEGGVTPTPTETTTPPAETTPATTPASTPATNPAATTPATKAPLLAVTGAGNQPFLLLGALLMGGGALLLVNRTLRIRKH